MDRTETVGRAMLLALGITTIGAIGMGADGAVLFLMGCLIGFVAIMSAIAFWR